MMMEGRSRDDPSKPIYLHWRHRDGTFILVDKDGIEHDVGWHEEAAIERFRELAFPWW
jgi:hypothetical protein